MLGSNMSALQGFAGSDATSTALSFATGSVVRQPSLHVKQRRLFSDSVRRRRQNTMPIYRAEKSKDYTIMSNTHLRDGRLSLKAKGLLSYMLSLPDNWRFSTRGLIANCREGAGAVRKALCELEAAGYLRRTRIRSENGSYVEGAWSIYTNLNLKSKI